MLHDRNSHWMCSVKIDVLKDFIKLTGNTCAGVSLLIKVSL